MNTDKRVSTGTRLKQIMSERGLKQVDILKASEPYQKKFNVQLKKARCLNMLMTNSLLMIIGFTYYHKL